MHFAVHGHTAAELIYERADAEKPHMGLTTWEDAPDGKIMKSDVTVAKNYLTEEEMRVLSRIVSAYLFKNTDVEKTYFSAVFENRYKKIGCKKAVNRIDPSRQSFITCCLSCQSSYYRLKICFYPA